MYIYYTQKRSAEAITKERGSAARLPGNSLAGHYIGLHRALAVKPIVPDSRVAKCSFSHKLKSATFAFSSDKPHKAGCPIGKLLISPQEVYAAGISRCRFKSVLPSTVYPKNKPYIRREKEDEEEKEEEKNSLSYLPRRSIWPPGSLPTVTRNCCCFLCATSMWNFTHTQGHCKWVKGQDNSKGSRPTWAPIVKRAPKYLVII